MSISTDNVLPSPHPDRWNFLYIFVQGESRAFFYELIQPCVCAPPGRLNCVCLRGMHAIWEIGRLVTFPLEIEQSLSVWCKPGIAFGMWLALSSLIFIFTVNRTHMWVNWTNNRDPVALLHQYDSYHSGINNRRMKNMVYLQAGSPWAPIPA